ncbi:MAG: putative Ig domain-containing protein, partial [Thermoplasmata archaeon]|nr:putative Ig domain-containing protein [Thermoplasmata archaeon]
NDNIYVVWYDNTNMDGSGTDYDIFYRANLTSSSWEDIQIISEPVAGSDNNTVVSRDPAIAVENSRIYVVWSDKNDTNGADIDYDIFYRCNLTNSGWENVQILSEPTMGANFNTGESYVPDIAVNFGKSYVVWRDTNNTKGAGEDEDIFYRCTEFLPPFLSFPSVTPTSGNTSSYFNFTVTYTQAENKAPDEIKVNLNGTNYSMLEAEPDDMDYGDGKSYYYNITHLDIGLHTYRFWASDGYYTRFTELVNYPIVYNTIPRITTEDDITAVEDTYYEVSYEYEDIDISNIGQSGTWEFSTEADDWLAFNPTTATLYGTPSNDDVGEYWVNIAINDTIDMDFTNFTLTVIDVNGNPIITTADVELTYEDELYQVDYNATDIDSLIENQIWSLETNASSWLDIDSDEGILSGTPTNDEIGSYWVKVSVDDGEEGSDFNNFTLIVLNVNDRPIITTEALLTASADKLYNVDYNATDIDSPLSKQTWSLTTNASSWLTISSTTGVLSGTPTISDIGWYNVNVTVDDGDGGLDWREFILTVVLGNTPPSITTIDVVSATANELYQVDYEAVDDRTPIDKLMWSLDTDAGWLSFDTTTGVLTGTPKLSDVGEYSVKVSVSDGEGGFDY